MTDAELEELERLLAGLEALLADQGARCRILLERYSRVFRVPSLLSTIRTLKAEVENLEGFRRDVATLLLSGDDMGDGTVFNPDSMGDQHECLESLIVKARALSALDQEDTP